MQTKHFFSDPTHVVNQALYSLTVTNPSLGFDKRNKIIFRRPTLESTANPKVSIVTGGGSGHEPAFAGYVGKGLVTASAAGTIFASPSAEQVRRAVSERVEDRKGVLVITMNYTGDVLNFGMAAEKAKAAGIATEFFAIGDDVGVGRKKGGKVGRRGIGGGILTLKVIGALAEADGTLDEVYNLAKLTTANTITLGSSLEHVHVPGRDLPDAHDLVPDGEVEVGMGIHNEPGSYRVKQSLEELVQTMLKQLLDLSDTDRAFLQYNASDKFVMLINNLGGLSTLELSGITAEASQQLERDWKIKPVRVIQGTFLTSLNGMGFSISLLKLVDTGLGKGKSMLELLDAPAEAIGWTAPVRTDTWDHASRSAVDRKKTALLDEIPSNLRLDPTVFKQILSAGLQRVIKAEPVVTRYDTIVGDGDCGIGLKRGAEAVLAHISSPSTRLGADVVNAVIQIIPVVENTMDGTSGAIYAIFLNALAHGLRAQDVSGTETPISAKIWAGALDYSLKALGKYTPAQPGDRTLVDALAPFITALAVTNDVDAAAKAAAEGTEKTKGMKASLGRAVYVGGEDEWVGKVPDPGAYGLSEFLQGIAEAAQQ